MAAVALYWLRARRADKVTLAWQLILGGLIALALARVGGHLYNNPRPFVTGHLKPLFPHAPDNGFPSDHALLTSFLAFALWRWSRGLSIALVVNAVLVGGARVLAHVHHVIDILGSWGFSLVAVLVIAGIERWRAHGLSPRRRGAAGWRS